MYDLPFQLQCKRGSVDILQLQERLRCCAAARGRKHPGSLSYGPPAIMMSSRYEAAGFSPLAPLDACTMRAAVCTHPLKANASKGQKASAARVC